MQESFPNPEVTPKKQTLSVFSMTMIGVVLVAVAASAWFLMQPSSVHAPLAGSATLQGQMTPAEHAYLQNIQIENIALSRAENFLNQEVTILKGEVYNGGNQPVSGLRLTTTFSDEMNQIALRETRAVLGSPEQPLAPGERRVFEISFDHVPNSWNMQQPVVVPATLQLPSR
jgi:hypothetical protein